MTLNMPHSTAAARRTVLSTLAAVILAAALPQSGFAQTDPLVGTWKLNLARSTYTAGPAPRSLTQNFQAAGPNLTLTADVIDAQGRPTKLAFMYIYDGQPHTATGSPDFDTRAYTRVDANTVIFTSMKAGKVVSVGFSVLSPEAGLARLPSGGSTWAGSRSTVSPSMKSSSPRGSRPGRTS